MSKNVIEYQYGQKEIERRTISNPWVEATVQPKVSAEEEDRRLRHHRMHLRPLLTVVPSTPDRAHAAASVRRQVFRDATRFGSETLFKLHAKVQHLSFSLFHYFT